MASRLCTPNFIIVGLAQPTSRARWHALGVLRPCPRRRDIGRVTAGPIGVEVRSVSRIVTPTTEDRLQPRDLIDYLLLMAVHRNLDQPRPLIFQGRCQELRKFVQISGPLSGDPHRLGKRHEIGIL